MIVIEERKICRMLEGLFQFDKECEWNDAIEEAMHRFVNLPTIDAVEVVRCKDCINFTKGKDEWGSCFENPMKMWRETDFCSWGERREDESVES